MNHTRKKYNNLLIDFKTMEIYYTKQEYNAMEKRLSKQLKMANDKIKKLEAKIKELKAPKDVTQD